MVNTKEDAEAMVRACLYSPLVIAVTRASAANGARAQTIAPISTR